MNVQPYHLVPAFQQFVPFNPFFSFNQGYIPMIPPAILRTSLGAQSYLTQSFQTIPSQPLAARVTATVPPEKLDTQTAASILAGIIAPSTPATSSSLIPLIPKPTSVVIPIPRRTWTPIILSRPSVASSEVGNAKDIPVVKDADDKKESLSGPQSRKRKSPSSESTTKLEESMREKYLKSKGEVSEGQKQIKQLKLQLAKVESEAASARKAEKTLKQSFASARQQLAKSNGSLKEFQAEAQKNKIFLDKCLLGIFKNRESIINVEKEVKKLCALEPEKYQTLKTLWEACVDGHIASYSELQEMGLVELYDSKS